MMNYFEILSNLFYILSEKWNVLVNYDVLFKIFFLSLYILFLVEVKREIRVKSFFKNKFDIVGYLNRSFFYFNSGFLKHKGNLPFIDDEFYKCENKWANIYYYIL